jgi:hypothetical protein
VTAWVDRLYADLDRLTLAEVLVTSPEGVEAQLAGLYEAALGRPLDESGLAYWRDLILRGISFTDVGTHLFGSVEFFDAGGATHDGFVRGLYRELLGREPDEPGVAHWVGLLARGARRFEVASSFYRSPESRSDRVLRLYRQLLEREPDTAGWEHWTERLLREDDLRLATFLVASDEFLVRAVAGRSPSA